MKKLPIIAALMALCGSVFAESLNVDELKHKMVPLPNGGHIWVIEHLEHNWRVVDPLALTAADARDPDICFEAKYDAIGQPDKLKLFGMKADLVITVDERIRHRAKSEFKQSDNIWICGSLKKVTGKTFEILATDVQKLPPDVQRFKAKIGMLEKQNNFEALIELGQRIEVQRKQEIRGFKEDEDMGLLRDQAFDIGLTMKEKSLKDADADGMFALALQWKGLRKKGTKFRELVMKALKINPDHPEASRVAQEELQLVRFEDLGWISQDKKTAILEQREIDKKRQDQASRDQAEARARDRERAIANRLDLLVSSQAKLRSASAADRQKAIDALGEAIQTTIDPGFGEEAIDILANLDDASAVSPGLEKAVKSEMPELRRQSFEALAFKLSQQNSKAVEVMSGALALEKDQTTAKVGVEALVSSGGKPAVTALIASLSTNERVVRDEILEALKTMTKQSFPNKEGWNEWWSKNSDSFNPN